MVNSFIIFKLLNPSKGLKLEDFRLSVVDELIGMNCQKKRGRPCTSIPSIPATKTVKTPESIRTSVQKHFSGVYGDSSKHCFLCSTKPVEFDHNFIAQHAI